MPKKKRKECFVIVPIAETPKHTAEYWTMHFNDFLKPLIEESGKFEARRSEPLRGDILKEIIKCLFACPLVVADITDENPNVYWELGVRHSFKHGTVIIAEEDTEPRFDISTQGVLFYNPGEHTNRDFRTSFKKAINSCISEPERTDSHVLEAISGRGTLFEVFRHDETIRRLDALILECRVNQVHLAKTMDNAKKNVKSRKGRKMMTSSFGKAAVELMLTNRYIDAGNDLYISGTLYLDDITALNGQISYWHQSRAEDADDWLLKVKETMASDFKDFNDKIHAIREAMAEGL